MVDRISTGKQIDFLLRDAHAKGICYSPTSEAERKHLDRQVKNGSIVKPMHGAYTDASWWNDLTPLQRTICLAKTCAQKCPHWVFCGATAAALWGLSPAYSQLQRLHIAVPARAKYRNTDLVQCHRLQFVETERLNGVTVTTPEQTTIDCIRSFPLADGLGIADAATRTFQWDNLYVLRALAMRPEVRLRGIGRARMVALLADGLSESGGESAARANIVRAGFQLPELQVEVPGIVNPWQTHRVDFAWIAQDGTAPLYGELDGRIKYTDQSFLKGGDTIDALLRERRRESELTVSSRAIVRLSYPEARSLLTLTTKLDAFGVPRVQQQPLELNGDTRHDLAKVVNYLELNVDKNSTVDDRLKYVESHRDELGLW